MKSSSFVRNFLAYGVATFLEKGAALILLPIYTSKFSTEEYGIIDICNTLLIISMALGMLQLETSLQRFYYEYKEASKKRLLFNVLCLVFFFSLLISCLLCFFSRPISETLFHSDEYSNLIRILAFQVPIQNLTILGLVILRFEERNKLFFLISFIKVFLTLTLSYLIIVFLEKGLLELMIGQLFSQVLGFIILFFLLRKDIDLRFDIKFQHDLLNYSLPQFPARLGSLSISEINKFFILSLLSLSSVGLYSVSLKLASSIQLFNTAFILAWSPLMFSLFKNENNRVFFRLLLPLVSSIVFFLVLLISLFSEELVIRFVSIEYMESYKYVGGIALFFALYIVKEVIDIGPKITKKTKYLSINFFVSVVFNFLFLLLLTPKYGLAGIVISLILTNIVLISISWYTSNKLYYINHNRLIFIGLLVPILVVSYSVMNFDFSIYERVLTFLILGGFYLMVFFNYYKKLAILKRLKVPE